MPSTTTHSGLTVSRVGGCELGDGLGLDAGLVGPVAGVVVRVGCGVLDGLGVGGAGEGSSDGLGCALRG